MSLGFLPKARQADLALWDALLHGPRAETASQRAWVREPWEETSYWAVFPGFLWTSDALILKKNLPVSCLECRYRASGLALFLYKRGGRPCGASRSGRWSHIR